MKVDMIGLNIWRNNEKEKNMNTMDEKIIIDCEFFEQSEWVKNLIKENGE